MTVSEIVIHLTISCTIPITKIKWLSFTYIKIKLNHSEIILRSGGTFCVGGSKSCAWVSTISFAKKRLNFRIINKLRFLFFKDDKKGSISFKVSIIYRRTQKTIMTDVKSIGEYQFIRCAPLLNNGSSASI